MTLLGKECGAVFIRPSDGLSAACLRVAGHQGPHFALPNGLSESPNKWLHWRSDTVRLDGREGVAFLWDLNEEAAAAPIARDANGRSLNIGDRVHVPCGTDLVVGTVTGSRYHSGRPAVTLVLEHGTQTWRIASRLVKLP